MPPLEGYEEIKEENDQNFNFKQIINQISNIMSTNKSQKQFKQIQKQNQANTIFTLSTQ